MTVSIEKQKTDAKIISSKIAQIREKILNDEFKICLREKNLAFTRKFKFIKKAQFKTVLLNLNICDFINSEEEDNPLVYGFGMVYVFIKEIELFNICGEKEKVNLYIKIKVPDIENNLIVISFHICEF